MMLKRSFGSAVLLAVSLAGAACGGNDSEAELAALRSQLAQLEERLATLAGTQSAQAATASQLDTDKANAADVYTREQLYTRAEVDHALAVQPWTASIPMESAKLEGLAAEYVVGGGGSISGLRLQESGFARFHVGFTLPDTYQPGTDIELRMTWAKVPAFAGPCNFELTTNGISAFRPGRRPFNGGDHIRGTSPMSSSVVVPAPTTDEVQQLIIDVRGDFNGAPAYQPGDHLSYSLFRLPTSAADTCTGTNAAVVVLGMSAHPRGA